jgi:hypothetical protein
MRVRSRFLSPWAAGLAVTLAAASAVIALQPLNGPWYANADADATYTASSLNILKGTHTRYLDHPGLPLQQLLAVTFAARYAVGRALGHETSVDAYVDRMLLDLNATRPYFRGWAIVFYLLGAALSYILIGRLFGHWLWALASGLLWISATALAPLSIQYRPDVVLAILLLVIGYLTIRAFERRDAVLYGLAALVLGFAMMVKVTAVGLAVPLLLAAVVHHPRDGWWHDVHSRAVAFAHRHRKAIAVVLSVWILIAAFLNYRGWPFGPSPTARMLVAETIVVLGAYIGLGVMVRKRHWRGGRIADPFLGFLLALIGVGIALPATLTLGEGVQSFVSIKSTLTGGGATGTYPWFWISLGSLVSDYPTREAAVLFALAAVAGIVGIRRKTAWPLIWAVGALVLGAMAWARFSNQYYFSAGYVVAVPAVLWLLRNSGRRIGATLALGLASALLAITFSHPVHSEPGQTACSKRAQSLLAPRLGATSAVLTTYVLPDRAYSGLVAAYVNYVPPQKVYRDLDPSLSGLVYARDHHLTVRYYAGPAAAGIGRAGSIDVPGLGRRRVRAVSGGSACGVVALVKPVRG